MIKSLDDIKFINTFADHVKNIIAKLNLRQVPNGNFKKENSYKEMKHSFGKETFTFLKSY